MMAVSLQKLFQQTFEDHKGRPGKVGGSVPRGTSSSSYKDREYEYARYILTRKIGDPLPPHIEEFDKDFTWDDDKYPTLGDWARATVDRYSINKTIEDSAGILTKEDRSKLKFISKKIGGFTEPYKVEITKPKKLSELDWNHLGEWGYTPHSLIPSHLQAVGWWDSPSEEKPFWTIYVAETDLAPRDEIFWHEFSHTLSTNVVDEITGGIQEGETTGDRNDRFARFMARGMKHQQQGHFGHKGRPGQVGGSLPRTRTGISDLAKRHLKYDREEYINKVDRILDEMPLSPRLTDIAGEINLDVREDMGSSYAGHFGNTIQVSRGAVEGKFGKTLSESYRYAPTVLHGVIAHEMGHHIQGRLEFEEQVRWNELIENRSLFSEFKKNKLPDINEQFASPLRGNELFAEAFAYYMWDPTLRPDPVLDYMDSIAMDIPVKKNSRLFIHGGQGSGFHGHRGRPGQVGGSSKGDRSLEDVLDTGDSGPPGYDNPEERRKYFDKRVEEAIAKTKERKKNAEDTVKTLGFPVDKLETTEDPGYLFSVGGKQFRAGADYDPATGKIRVFDIDEMDQEKLQGILAHEVQHSRWKTYHDAYQKQFIEVEKSLRSTDDKTQWLIRMDGSIRNPEDRERLWAYDIHQEFMSIQSSGWKMLRREDGITTYSEAYWKQANTSQSAFDYDRAVDETLAEIARMKAKGSAKKIAPVWNDLYKRVNKNTVKKNQKLFLFGGEGSGFRDHKGRPGKVGGSIGKKKYEDMRARNIFPHEAVRKPRYMSKLVEYKRMDPRDLYPTQQHIGGDTLNAYKEGKGHSQGEPVAVVYHEGKYIIVDGHNRAALAILENVQEIDVKVIE